MKPVVFGIVGVVVVVAALGAVAVFVGPRDGGGPASAPQAAGAPKAATRPDNTAPMLVEAERLLNRGDTPAAKDLYTRARAQYRRDNNAAGEAAAAFGLGKLEHFNGQSAAARTAFTEALALFERAGDVGGQARVEIAFGDLEKDTFRGAQAMQRYRSARALWARAPEPKSDPHVLLNLDRAPQMPAGETRARAVIEQADKIFHNIGDVEGEGDAAMMLGALDGALGNVKAGQAALMAARDRYAEAGVRSKEGAAVLRVAEADIGQGYNIAAGERLAEAAAALAGDPVAEARVGLLRAELERLQGRLELARDEYRRSIQVLAGEPDEGPALVALGQVQAWLGDTEGALASFHRAIDVARVRRDRRTEASAALELGAVHFARGDLAAAQGELATAAERFSALRDRSGEGRVLLAQAGAAAALGDVAAAMVAFDASRARFSVSNQPFGVLLAFLGTAEAARAAGDAASAAQAAAAARDLRRQVPDLVASAGRLLGRSETGSLQYVVGGEEPEDGLPPDPAVVRAAQEVRAANRARYPNANAEARSLAESAERRIAAFLLSPG